jgi:Na+/H+ antiporter NhaD/arsenite permease-like protein
VVDLTGGHLLAATMLVLVVSVLLSAVVDNIPYVAAMTPLVLALSQASSGDVTVLWWALAIGADLGGNATSIGASANVVLLGVAERAGHRIGFRSWLRTGIPVTLVTVGIAAVYLWVRYFVLA